MDDDDAIEREERGIYLIMLLAGLPVAIALAIEGRAIDGGNALLMGIVALSVIGLAAGGRAVFRDRIPRARVYPTTSDPAAGTRLPPR